MDVPPTQTGADERAARRAADVPQDRETCLQLARLLGQPDQRTAAIAELLFSVWQDVRRFDSLALDGVEPAVTFSAAWD